MYVSSKYHPERRGGRDADRNLPAKGPPTQDINATSNGRSITDIVSGQFQLIGEDKEERRLVQCVDMEAALVGDRSSGIQIYSRPDRERS